MEPRGSQRLVRPLLAGLLIGLAALALFDAPAVRRLETATLDWRFLLRGPIPAGPDVALVVLDEPSLAALGGWPPSRAHLAETVRRLDAAGARTIVLDLLFLDGAGGPADPAATDAFAREIAAAGNVVLGYALSFGPAGSAGRAGPTELPPHAALHRYVLPPEGAPDVPRATGAAVPAPPLAEAAAALGHMSVFLAADGALRHDAAVVRLDDEFYPSLALQGARLAQRLPPSELSAHFGRGLGLGRRGIPTERGMRLPVNFYGPFDGAGADGTAGFETVPLIDLLEGRVAAAAVSGRAVVVGSTALAAGPGFVTPYDANMPPAAFTATALDNLLTGRNLVRPEWLRGLEVLAAALGAALAFAFARRIPPVAAPLAAALPLAAWAGAAMAVFVAWHVWLAVAVPAAAIAAGAGFGALSRSRAEQRRRAAVARERANLSRYFSPAVAERLAHQDRPLAAGAQQDATVLFVDIRGFTALCERLPPRRALELLRGFHRRVERAVFARGGTLDKYLGDGALAVFGVPEPQPDEAAQALAAAVALQEDLAAWRAELAAEGLPAPQASVGLHHGPVLAGDVGGETRFEFTVLGDTVNVASRLEGLTRELGVAIVASEATVERAGAVGEIPFGFYRHGEVGLRGRETPIPVWVWRPHGAQRGERLATG